MSKDAQRPRSEPERLAKTSDNDAQRPRAPARPAWSVALRLGRVSNLPTVWTNALAAAAIAGGPALGGRSAAVVLAMSLAYTGGMYLNDAFDREIDARERPERPIPAGEASAGLVFAAGFALLAGALALLAAVSLAAGRAGPLVGGVLLCAAIVAYDRAHKGVAHAPLLMGLCRALVYWTAALAAAPDSAPAGADAAESARAGLAAAGWGGAALWAYVVGLSCAAAQENLLRLRSAWPLALLAAPLALAAPALAGAGALGAGCAALWLAWVGLALWRMVRPHPDLRGGVTGLIAGISLVDALLCSAAGAGGIALLCLAGAPLTRRLQRGIPGT